MRSPLIAAAFAAAAVVVLAPLSPASAADPADIGCHGGSLNVHFTPGVTFSKNNVQLSASGEMGICTSAAHPKITTGTVRFTAPLTAACPGPYGPGYATATINWNDGTKTVINQTTFRGTPESFSLEGGSVTDGTFAGGTARANGHTTTPMSGLGAACVFGGITSYETTIDQFAVGDI